MNKRNTIILFIAVVTAFASCTPDDGLNLDDRDNFVGSWTCRDSSKTNADVATYTVIVSRKGDLDTVLISNFYNIGNNNSAIGLVSGTSIVIPNQIVDSWVITGSGIYSNNKFSITYSATLGTSVDNGYAVYQ
jgi:uncharacterized protein affecting Mg2+/Co2+ transport